MSEAWKGWGRNDATPEALVRDYLRAKDENRAHLIASVFCESACLEMRVKTQDISFPAVSQGSATIADVLARRFNQSYENIYTFCLDKPAAESENSANSPPAVFVCDWLVGMSEKANGNVRVGCGRYEWVFRQKPPCRVERLNITIETMQTLPAHSMPEILKWLLALDYPWSSAQAVCRSAPEIKRLDPVLRYLGRALPSCQLQK
jgi:hypothetical protein